MKEINENHLKSIIIFLVAILFSTYVSIAVWCIKESLETKKKRKELEKKELIFKNRKLNYESRI